ncbi:PREDICTED: uncharacterized protein LOC108620698 [Drosophila arizonae]|uniref:Uncharacterized protein LOC108620698 n=1 Tax=Drosophila arizonae TaxID=7263 RepID=A0ABM1Q0W0_DROAR|nr:PREDICTED: uncharacterized protein LOC108620698 [Drosophila arizonae]XP_017873097.1 PREDICTED: uncharacterized protein LOC108620698 [Drosophila arizonae]
MSLMLHLLLLLLLFGEVPAFGRKVKRKDAHYHLNVPPPPPPAPQKSSASTHTVTVEHELPPYSFEAINHDEFAAPTHPQYESPQYESPRYESSDYASHSSHSSHSSSHAGSSGGYLVDNGLRSIAKGSADQAISAVASQNAAGKQASYVAKSTLAQAAAQAAGTAVAVLKGKEVLLHRLEEQSVEAHKSVERELTQLQQAKRSAKAAQYAAQQAINHVSVLTAALNNAQAASELAQKAAAEAAAELSSQIDMVAQAKGKLEQTESQAYAARLDYEETREAAEKATLSAQEAQLNANDAALHANVELSEAVHLHDKSDRNAEQSASSSGHRTRPHQAA